jgi:hypothetical protein
MDGFRFARHFFPFAKAGSSLMETKAVEWNAVPPNYFLTAMHSISMLAFFGNAATAMVLRAGN